MADPGRRTSRSATTSAAPSAACSTTALIVEMGDDLEGFVPLGHLGHPEAGQAAVLLPRGRGGRAEGHQDGRREPADRAVDRRAPEGLRQRGHRGVRRGAPAARGRRRGRRGPAAAGELPEKSAVDDDYADEADYPAPASRPAGATASPMQRPDAPVARRRGGVQAPPLLAFRASPAARTDGMDAPLQHLRDAAAARTAPLPAAARRRPRAGRLRVAFHTLGCRLNQYDTESHARCAWPRACAVARGAPGTSRPTSTSSTAAP